MSHPTDIMQSHEEVHHLFTRYPELKEFIRILRHEIRQAQRPANEVILTETDVIRMLKISQRTMATLKAERAIPYSQPRTRAACYFLLSDVLAWLEGGRVEDLKFLSR